MDNYLQQWHLQRLEGDLSVTRFKSITSQIVRALGFDFWRFTQVDHPQFSRQMIHAEHSNLPQDWQLLEANKPNNCPDPLLVDSLQNHRLITLDEAALALQPEFWEPAIARGLRAVWVQSATDVQTGYIGVLSLFGSTTNMTAAERLLKEHAVHWLAHRLHSLTSAGLKQAFKLSQTERTVMRWTAQGKAANEVAEITQIKERTVNFHISSVMSRLGVQNKTAAAVKLAMNGSLF